MTTPYSKRVIQSLKKEEVLSFSMEDRLAYFHAVRLTHPNVTTALNELMLMSNPGSGADISLLVGPTGVGKSTLVSALRERILERQKAQMLEDRAMIPVAMAEAPASGERGFSWRIFYQRLGESLQEPLMSRKQETISKEGRIEVRPVSTSATVAAMRTSIEKALLYRKTSMVVVDEAVHILRNIQGTTLENHMDALKSLANVCGVNMVLVGSYDLLPVLRLSAQVARRTTPIHLRRYLTGEPADEQAFSSVLKKLGTYLPLEEEIDLSPYASDLQRVCIGCVGILKETLSRALAITLLEKGKWRESHLERALLAPMQHKAILEETLAGETQMPRVEFGSGSFKAVIQQYKDIELMAVGGN